KRKQLQLVLYILEAAAHQTLDRINRPLRRFDQIPARGIADYDLVVLVERDHREDKVQPIFSGDDDRRIPLHVGHERVRGAEIDADDVVSCHWVENCEGQIADCRGENQTNAWFTSAI